MEFKIIPADAGIVDSIAEIENACFSTPWTKENIEESLSSGNAHFLAAQAEEIIGYIGVTEVAGEAYIANIAVLPEYRREGIGEALIKSAEDAARGRGCEFITLEVRESNFAAISLYEKRGFEKAGQRKCFYTNPAEDAVIYTKYFRGEV